MTSSMPSAPTGASIVTGVIRLAAKAKYSAEPPSSSCTVPNGPSSVSRAIDPATRSPAVTGATSRPPPGTGGRSHDVVRTRELVEKVGRPIEVLHLHPAATQLDDTMCVRSGRRYLAELRRERGRRGICLAVGPRVVDLDDVDPRRELHQPALAVVRAAAI